MYGATSLLQRVSAAMGHHISAIVSKLPYDEAAAERYGLPVFAERGFAIVGLDPSHSDHWAEELGLGYGGGGLIILDNTVTHFFAEKLFGDRPYAVIETEYHGGQGVQAAAVFQRGQVLMPAEQSEGGVINKALATIGVEASFLNGCDAFDYLRLGNYRHFDDAFEKYWG